MIDSIKKNVIDYYSSKFLQYGSTPKGVDWNSEASQYIRFKQLSQVLKFDSKLTILDFGCGYGEFYNYLKNNKFSFPYNYIGFDISTIMLEAGIKKYQDIDNVSFIHDIESKKFDFTIASGVFNVKANFETDNVWLNYVLSTLNQINEVSIKGFSFNMLTSFSNRQFMKDNLFYANPMYIFEYCKNNFSKNIALLHDYDLFEFTILVRKL